MSDYTISPVIGVILMVAITVILAGVLAVFVFGGIADHTGNVGCEPYELRIILPQSIRLPVHPLEKIVFYVDVTGYGHTDEIVVDPSRITEDKYNKIRDLLNPGNPVTFQVSLCSGTYYIADVTVG
jgi:flagellin-like protein